MNCTNCGSELEEGALFCTSCGMRVPETNGNAASEIPAEPVASAQENQNPAAVPFQQPQVTEQPYNSAPAEPSGKKHGLLVAGILGVLALLVVVGVVFLVKTVLFSGKSLSEKSMVYQKDGTLYYVPNMDKEKDPIEIDDIRGDGNWSYKFSKSGKYLYICARDGRNTLSRVEIGKLKAGSDKNAKYIQEIDTKVGRFDLIDDERLVYTNESGKLYYYDGKEEDEIDKDVDDFHTTSGDYIYYTISKDAGYEYCYYDISKKDGDSICKDVQTLDCDWEKGLIYTFDEGEVSRITRDGEEETLIEDAQRAIGDAEHGVIYFFRERQEEHTLYDFVDDPYASQDAGVTEPVFDDYWVKVSEADALSAYDKMYYAQNPDEKADFYYYLSWDYSYNMNRYYNNDDNQTYYYNANEDQWYKYDRDAYDADCQKYYDVSDRIYLREDLKSQNYTKTYYDLYVWTESDGEKELAQSVINSNLTVDTANQIIIYNKDETADRQMDKVSIDSISGAYEIRERLEYGYDDDSEHDAIYYVNVKGNESELDAYVSYMEVSEDGKTAILWEQEDEETVLASYEVSSDGLERVDTIGEDVISGEWVDDSFYFTTGEDDYGNLNVYKGRETNVLVKDVYLYDIRVFGDGNTCAFKDRRDGELRIYNSKGDDKKFTSDVEDYQYVNEKRIVYMKKDNLYVYTGKDEDRRIVRNLGSNGGFLCYAKSDEVYRSGY